MLFKGLSSFKLLICYNQSRRARIYQIVAGYEDVIDSNYLRHDPIF
jgi:hypothetical protein